MKWYNNKGCNIYAFILNITFSIFGFIGGVLTNSVAILSDSVHDFWKWIDKDNW